MTGREERPPVILLALRPLKRLDAGKTLEMTLDASNLELTPLTGTAAEVKAVHEVLVGAQDYSLIISGVAPTMQDAQDIFTSLPPGIPR